MTPQATDTTETPLSFLGTEALALAGRGLAVFPLTPSQKVPFSKNHVCDAPFHQHGFKDATTDPETIRAWWTAHPAANIGVATGKISGITVLDVDVKPWENKQGDKSLAALTDENGDLPATPTQYTWSGGSHYIFAYAPGVGNSAGKLGKDLDIRGDGGYIVVAPSVVEDDGRSGEYAWDIYAGYDEVDLAPMPMWMVARLVGAPGKTSRSAPGWTDPIIEGVSQGTRDDTCWRLINRYVLLNLSEDEVLRIMLDWAARCQPPFDETSVREKVTRSFRRLQSKRILSFALTDAGNAERMALLYGDRFRHVLGKKGEWLDWDGRRWKPGSTEAVEGYALDAARMLDITTAKARLGDDLSEDQKRKLANHAIKSESAKGIRDATYAARLLKSNQIERKLLDTDPNKLNVANGTLDLTTFTLTPHDPDDLMTKIIEIAYDPLATAPRWEQFLQEVFQGRQDVIDYVQRAVGYTLTGSIKEQCCFFAYGAGANGKSTFIEVLTAVFGEYAAKIAQEALLTAEKNKGRGATPELMEFVGARFAYIDEMEEERRLDEARIKALTGAEKETGRGLYKGMTTWMNTAKLWFDLNALPSFKGIDEGISRRPRVILFDRKFEKADQDPGLAEKLKLELPGILAWAVEGCRQWRAQGLNEPPSISLATGEYTDSQNHLPRFMADTFVQHPSEAVTVADLNTLYGRWCVENAETSMSREAVKSYVKNVWKLREGKRGGGRAWIGITVKTQGK